MPDRDDGQGSRRISGADLMSELESLGLSTIKLNEFNDNSELKSLVSGLKQQFLDEYRRAVTQ
jgi:hypothetical protein